MSHRSGAGAWVALAVCAALILGSMGWLTRGVLEAEAERSLAESRADLEERIRLSLWRMDTMAAALTIAENQQAGTPGAGLPDSPLVQLRFRIDPAGQPRPLDGADPEKVAQLNALLDSDNRFGTQFQMLCAASREDNQWAANYDASNQTLDVQGTRQSLSYQSEMNFKERAARGKVFNNAVSQAGPAQRAALPEPRLALGVATGAFQPTWIGEQPFLLRQVRNEFQVLAIEGVWIDAVAFRSSLLSEIADLLAHADLVPSPPSADARSALALASFPWRLIPGEEPVAETRVRGPVLASMVAGWVAVVVALLAGAALVRGIMRLSERRASFVSAVTHELRTPLTTFRLYSDMLESGAVRDETKQAGYFRTMRREADRLSHLVENVLAFSRIERGSDRTPVRSEPLGPLVEGLRERLAERLAAAQMELRVGEVPEISIRGNAAAIEHILFNLVDNAAKYGTPAEQAVVEIRVAEQHGNALIEVRDHGPGIGAAEEHRVFRPFHKSAQAAAESRPGVGLGLSLSRRLARQMGGTLRYEEARPGARFVLSLPLAER